MVVWGKHTSVLAVAGKSILKYIEKKGVGVECGSQSIKMQYLEII